LKINHLLSAEIESFMLVTSECLMVLEGEECVTANVIFAPIDFCTDKSFTVTLHGFLITCRLFAYM